MQEQQEQIDYHYRRRGWKIRLPLWLITLLIFAVLFYKGWQQEKWDWFWISAFIIAALAGLGFEAWLKRSYRCPQCGLRLGKPRILPRDGSNEYVYDCGNCGILWRTRTHVPRD